jgi:hypothetical protein
MAFMASFAMLPAVANAQPVSRQDRARTDANAQRRVYTGRNANSNTYADSNPYANSNVWAGNRVQAYRQPPRVSRSFSLPRARQQRANRTSPRDYRRR